MVETKSLESQRKKAKRKNQKRDGEKRKDNAPFAKAQGKEALSALRFAERRT
jgi:hypothetical protein